MRRIAIIGFSGGGKSTLAMRLGELLGIEPTHMDAIHWLHGWRENTVENEIKALAPVLERDRWIIDGNYSRVLYKERLDLADTVIFVDVNRFGCFLSAWRRSRIYRGRTRPDMGEGCQEKLDGEFIKWILIDSRRKRKRWLYIMDEVRKRGKTTYIFKSKRAINKFLEGMK